MKLALAFKREPEAAAAPVAAYVGDATSHEVLTAAFHERTLPAEAVRLGGAAAALRQQHADGVAVLFVDVGDSANPAADIAALAATGAATRLIAIGHVNDVQLFRDLIAAGAADYLVKPLSRPAISAAIGAALAATHKPPAEGGRVIAVMGTRGGVGATSLAVGLAWLLAEERKRATALVDLDLQFGSVALALDLEPGRGLREALERPARIDSLFLERALEKRGQRLHVLAAEEPLGDLLQFDPGAPAILLHELRTRFEAVVLDVPRAVGLIERQALAEAQDVILVSELSLGGLRDTLRLVGLVQECAPGARLLVAAAGDPKTARLDRAAFEKGLGRKVDLMAPFDRKAAQALGDGKPLPQGAPKCAAATALRTLAAGFDQTPAPRRGFALFRRKT